MSDKKIIAVVGATGAQGGGLVRAILADPNGGFAVRALTRDPSSPKAQALAQAGAEVIAVDVDDEDSLAQALQGAHGAYFVTFFWDHMVPEKELAQAGNMARAAKRAGVKHAIWSTLEDTRRFVPLDDDRMPTLQGKYKVPHFDAKGEADRLFAEAGVPTTNLLTSFYWDNLIHFGMGPKQGEDGRWTFVLPMGEEKLAGIAAEDIGRSAYGVFKLGEAAIGKTIGIAGDHISGAAMAKELSDALGRDIAYYAPTPEQYRGFGFPGADDLGNMFQVYQEFQPHFESSRPVAATRALSPQLQSFGEWVKNNASRLG